MMPQVRIMRKTTPFLPSVTYSSSLIEEVKIFPNETTSAFVNRASKFVSMASTGLVRKVTECSPITAANASASEATTCIPVITTSASASEATTCIPVTTTNTSASKATACGPTATATTSSSHGLSCTKIVTSIFTVMSLVLVSIDGVRGQSPDPFPGAPPIQYSSLSGPTFINPNKTSIKALAGTTAKLPCAVKNLHNHTVSWVRASDISLLTSSSTTYTRDSRFVAAKLAGGSQWLLKIHYVRAKDAGVYLCQVSTTPPLILSIDLAVQESVASVTPGQEVYVQLGSRLEVTCKVEGCPHPALLTWMRSGHSVPTSAPEAYNATVDNVTVPVTILKLAKSEASPADTGNYSCSSTCTESIGVTVHVLKGEELAAMQQPNMSHQHLPSCLLIPCLLLCLVLHWHGHDSSTLKQLDRGEGASVWSTNKESGESVLLFSDVLYDT